MRTRTELFIFATALGAWLVACDDSSPSESDVDGGLDASFSDASDADASSDSGCMKATWCRDADEDGFGDPNDCVEVCWGEVVEGYVFDNDEDCYDDNADARPGQTVFFEEHRGDGSFDYDCDDEEELWRPDLVQGCEYPLPDPPPPYFRGWQCVCAESAGGECVYWLGCVIPDCGEEATWIYQGCTTAGTQVAQRCR